MGTSGFFRLVRRSNVEFSQRQQAKFDATLLLQPIDFLLEKVKKAGSVGTVHLSVVKLKWHGEGGLEPVFTVSSPNHERVIEYAAVHADCAVYVELRQRRCADHHAVCHVMILARRRDLPRQP